MSPLVKIWKDMLQKQTNITKDMLSTIPTMPMLFNSKWFEENVIKEHYAKLSSLMGAERARVRMNSPHADVTFFTMPKANYELDAKTCFQMDYNALCGYANAYWQDISTYAFFVRRMLEISYDEQESFVRRLADGTCGNEIDVCASYYNNEFVNISRKTHESFTNPVLEDAMEECRKELRGASAFSRLHDAIRDAITVYVSLHIVLPLRQELIDSIHRVQGPIKHASWGTMRKMIEYIANTLPGLVGMIQYAAFKNNRTYITYFQALAVSWKRSKLKRDDNDYDKQLLILNRRFDRILIDYDHSQGMYKFDTRVCVSIAPTSDGASVSSERNYYRERIAELTSTIAKLRSQLDSL